MKTTRLAAFLTVAAATVAAVLPEPAPTVFRTCATVLDAEVCTWLTMDGDRAVELGATIPLALIEAVPADAEMVWPPEQLGVVELPAEAKKALGIDHMGLNWEAHGHPPATFLAPHFDFHFYSIPQESVHSIDCADLSKPSALPAGYTLPDIEIPGMGNLVGLCVPRMGMHAMPADDAEATESFDASMILGYYGGEPIFFEPMVSRELLLERSDFTLPVPSVEGLPEGVRYPSDFRAEYDADGEQYRLVFSGFEAR